MRKARRAFWCVHRKATVTRSRSSSNRTARDAPDAPAPPPGLQLDALQLASKTFATEFGLNGSEQWRVAVASVDVVTYLTHTADGWITATVHLQDGEWVPGGTGDCGPMARASARGTSIHRFRHLRPTRRACTFWSGRWLALAAVRLRGACRNPSSPMGRTN